MNYFKKYSRLILVVVLCVSCEVQKDKETTAFFEPTQESAKPWVYWYWLQSAYSKEGITADLEAMKEAGLGGAYLMTIKGLTDPPLIDPPVLQLSPEFWDLIEWAFTEAGRLNLKIAFHAADGFAVAGGPWITPEKSMQKVVWADTTVTGGTKLNIQLPVPKHYKNYYEDIATFAIPIKNEKWVSSQLSPVISTSLKEDASFLNDPKAEGNFKLYEKGWFEYEFDKPFTCKSIQIETPGNNYQAHRLILEVSDDGVNYKRLSRLEAPRHGWQDTDQFYTHAIIPTTATHFRFVYNPEGTEPGAEDLDAAKWKQSLKVSKIILSEEACIDNYQGKSGAIWRISSRTTEAQIPKEDCIELTALNNISGFVDKTGILNWEAPQGNWRIMRFGHTSTGHENATGGAGKGLEVDKFDPEAIRFQLDHWFGEAVRMIGPELASKILNILHLDSWECGSQNWSPVFRTEFENRRGYDIVDYLPVMAGIPIEDAAISEGILYDIRKTISELIADNFFGTLQEEADKNGVAFSSENVAPTMVSDNLLHFKYVDFPGGEFWLRSPTHDKPNDMLDAISGGHIYGKNIIQAEAFTQLRMDWDEHPGNLKILADRNYALGINRFFYHVFVHNPWLDRKPGMTLDGVGSYFQRDQTWWKPGKAWVDYSRRVQFELQKGKPVIDLAVFTGEEIPSRSVLPDRLLPFIPNVFGEKRIKSEFLRLKNKGQPIVKQPKEVTYSKNATDLSQWVNALNGYKYDSFNADVLLNDARVLDGNVVFKGGITYKALLFPGARKMAPNQLMSLLVLEKIIDLVKEGATVLIGDQPVDIPGNYSETEKLKWEKRITELWTANSNTQNSWNLGKGTVVKLPYLGSDFSDLGFTPDILIKNPLVNRESIAWTHRTTKEGESYFVSNQKEEVLETKFSFRVDGRIPYIYNPESGEERSLNEWKVVNGRTEIPLKLNANESCFVLFKEKTKETIQKSGLNWLTFEKAKTLNENWSIQFDPEFHGPKNPIRTSKLFDWSQSKNDSIKYYSGTAIYAKTFNWDSSKQQAVWLHIGDVSNMAEVVLNDKNLGVLWTYPFRLNISKALKQGANKLELRVTNTWANRLIGDEDLPQKERLTWTTAPFRLEKDSLLKAGLLGPVRLELEKKNP